MPCPVSMSFPLGTAVTCRSMLTTLANVLAVRVNLDMGRIKLLKPEVEVAFSTELALRIRCAKVYWYSLLLTGRQTSASVRAPSISEDVSD